MGPQLPRAACCRCQQMHAQLLQPHPAGVGFEAWDSPGLELVHPDFAFGAYLMPGKYVYSLIQPAQAQLLQAGRHGRRVGPGDLYYPGSRVPKVINAKAATPCLCHTAAADAHRRAVDFVVNCSKHGSVAPLCTSTPGWPARRMQLKMHYCRSLLARSVPRCLTRASPTLRPCWSAPLTWFDRACPPSKHQIRSI